MTHKFSVLGRKGTKKVFKVFEENRKRRVGRKG
jgi:hypothetical protein